MLAANARQDQMRELSQVMAWIAYGSAVLIGTAINEPKKFPKLEDAFPSLFEKQAHQDWRIMKERVEGFAQVKNKQAFDV
ncbi:MAG: hypothetical protein FWC77_04130 [Defluviitaleaceae bacterium]|nr:hypothetical protein [Defluviitaleaceae bacterium]